MVPLGEPEPEYQSVSVLAPAPEPKHQDQSVSDAPKPPNAVPLPLPLPSSAPPLTVTWKGMEFRSVADERLRQQVMRYFGAQYTSEDISHNLQHLVTHGHAQVECSDTGSFTFAGSAAARGYSDLNRLTCCLPTEWTKTMTRSMDVLYQSVGQLLTSTRVASTQFVDVDVYQYVRHPEQLLVVHGSYSSERARGNKVSQLLFGPTTPSASLTAHIQIITLSPSFLEVVHSAPALSLRRLQEVLHI